jgi:hypothetical protein
MWLREQRIGGKEDGWVDVHAGPHRAILRWVEITVCTHSEFDDSSDAGIIISSDSLTLLMTVISGLRLFISSSSSTSESEVLSESWKNWVFKINSSQTLL